MLPRDTLLRFCASKNDVRVFLHTPSRHNGWIYASDGRILIRITDHPEIAASSDVSLADSARRVLEPIDEHADFSPLNVALPPPKVCESCQGSGKTMECGCCHGEGEIDVSENSRGTICPSCGGPGYFPAQIGDTGDIEDCWSCDGYGEGFQSISFTHANGAVVLFQRKYLALLQTLPGIVFCVPDSPNGVGFFRCAEGVGALMSCRR